MTVKKNTKADHYVNVADIETRKVVKQHGSFGSRRLAERAETAIQRGIDFKTSFTYVTTKKEPGQP